MKLIIKYQSLNQLPGNYTSEKLNILGTKDQQFGYITETESHS